MLSRIELMGGPALGETAECVVRGELVDELALRPETCRLGAERACLLLEPGDRAPLRVDAGKQRIAFAWGHGRVPVANALKRSGVGLAGERAQRIGTQLHELAAHPKVVPKILER